MKTLKLVWQAMIKKIGWIGSLHETAAQWTAQREREADLNEREAERIDRICNPSKYLGK